VIGKLSAFLTLAPLPGTILVAQKAAQPAPKLTRKATLLGMLHSIRQLMKTATKVESLAINPLLSTATLVSSVMVWAIVQPIRQFTVRRLQT